MLKISKWILERNKGSLRKRSIFTKKKKLTAKVERKESEFH